MLGPARGAELRAHLQQPLRPGRPVRPRAGRRGRPPGCTPARTAPSTKGPTASARSSRARARATAACWASARSSSRSEDGLALDWFGGRRWEFDGAGLPVRALSGPGTEVRFTHEDGRLVALAHAGGKRVSFEWEGERIVSASCSDGRHVEYAYDDGGDLVEANSITAGPRRYELDAEGRIVSVTDADGVVELVNTYDERRPGRRAGLELRPAHDVRLPPRAGHGHQRRAGRPGQHLRPRPRGPAAGARGRRRRALLGQLRRLGQPGRGHRAQRRGDRPGVGRARHG